MSADTHSHVVVRPILPVVDMAASTEFYQRLGFHVECFDAGYAWVQDDGHELFHLRLVPGLVRDTNRAACYLHVPDADERHARWSAAGVELTPIADEPWEMREFSLHDPSGNLIRVGHNL